MRTLYTIVLFLIGLVVGIFCVQNLKTVEISYLKWTMAAPLPAVALGIYVLGMLSGWAVFSFLRHTIRRVTVAEVRD